jgi:hypothetical protein
MSGPICSKLVFVPPGTFDDSPGFQRWERRIGKADQKPQRGVRHLVEHPSLELLVARDGERHLSSLAGL